MLYPHFAQACEKISSTTKRLEIRSLVAGLLRQLSPEEIGPALYMLQGQIRPEYEGVELGVGEALAIKSIALATDTDEPRIEQLSKESGDLGSTAEALCSRNSPGGPSTPLTVLEVYSAFLSVSGKSGSGSQEQKSAVIADLLRRASPVEAKHITRFLLGKLRLGVKEMTLIDALAEIYGEGEPKAARGQIETAFNVTSDLGEVGIRLGQGGPRGLEGTTVTLGKPVRAMLAEREATLQDVLDRMEGRASLEYKYDGLRLQAHVGKDRPPRLFSRRLEDLSEQFPEIIAAVRTAFKSLPVIVDGECVPFDPDTGDLRPFQDISRRRGRKYDLEKMMQDVPVKYVLFDLLLKGDQSCLAVPYEERRKMLEKVLIPGERIALSTRRVVDNAADADAFFQQALSDGCEGVVAKSVSDGSIYKPGGRGFWWIKYKREYTHELADTIDAVIVGAFQGRGKRAGWYGAFLMAIFDKQREGFYSLCKVGTGFDEATLETLTKDLKQTVVPAKPDGIETSLEPDVWVDPTIVLELRGAELSLSPVHYAARDLIREGYGLALRFPRYTGRRREDKSAEDCTEVGEVIGMYRSQVKKEAPRDAAPETAR